MFRIYNNIVGLRIRRRVVVEKGAEWAKNRRVLARNLLRVKDKGRAKRSALEERGAKVSSQSPLYIMTRGKLHVIKEWFAVGYVSVIRIVNCDNCHSPPHLDNGWSQPNVTSFATAIYTRAPLPGIGFMATYIFLSGDQRLIKLSFLLIHLVGNWYSCNKAKISMWT